MKLLIDQNISHRILPLIQTEFPDVAHVRNVGLKDANDHKIFMHARSHNFAAIITHDDDFLKLLRTFNQPPKIIQFRTGNARTKYLAELLISQLTIIETFLSDTDADYLEIFAT